MTCGPPRNAQGPRAALARSSDQELLELVAAGRAPALDVLYDRYAGLFYSLVLRILNDRGAAEDVVQDAFLAVWQKARTFDPERGRPYSWLLKIARNRAIDELRRQRSPSRGERHSWGFLPEEPPDPVADDPESDPGEVWAVELRSAVGQAMQELPDRQREVVEMAYFGGLSQREISESTGLPLGTVKTRTRLALKKLRETLQPAMSC